MLRRFLIFSLQLLQLQCADIPQLQVLYHSSDADVLWPPPGVEDQPHDQWPGHLEQLGKHHPRLKVNVAYKNGFPSAEDFYNNFVERKNPVVISKAVDNSDFDFLRLVNLNQSSRAALSFVDVLSFTSTEKQSDSLW